MFMLFIATQAITMLRCYDSKWDYGSKWWGPATILAIIGAASSLAYMVCCFLAPLQPTSRWQSVATSR